MMSTRKTQLLTEKYAPTKLSDVVGQEDVVKRLTHMVASKSVPDMLFVGPPGCGKTTVARCLARELGLYPTKYLELNASDERGIDTVRTKIKSFSKTLGFRILVLDEADSVTMDAQEALRGVITPQFQSDCVFILTGNRPQKIIEPLQSRCLPIYFKPLDEVMIVQRLTEICIAEDFDMSSGDAKDQLVDIVKSCKGDLRKALLLLQTSAQDGKIVRTLLHADEKVGLVKIAFRKALEGDLAGALESIEDAVLMRTPVDEIVETLSAEISSVENMQTRARLFIKLGDFDSRLRQGGPSVVHLGAFLSWVWVAPYAAKCPMLEES